eukprot:1178744-Prorocentrum_minimum.AAC.2
MAASPTPPEVACTKAQPLLWSNTELVDKHIETVTKTVGMVVALQKSSAAGFCGSMLFTDVATLPRHPGANPNTPSPGAYTSRDGTKSCNAAGMVAVMTTVPEQSPPRGPGSPGYIPSAFSTSRKFRPTACTCMTTAWSPETRAARVLAGSISFPMGWSQQPTTVGGAARCSAAHYQRAPRNRAVRNCQHRHRRRSLSDRSAGSHPYGLASRCHALCTAPSRTSLPRPSSEAPAACASWPAHPAQRPLGQRPKALPPRKFAARGDLRLAPSTLAEPAPANAQTLLRSHRRLSAPAAPRREGIRGRPFGIESRCCRSCAPAVVAYYQPPLATPRDTTCGGWQLRRDAGLTRIDPRSLSATTTVGGATPLALAAPTAPPRPPPLPHPAGSPLRRSSRSAHAARAAARPPPGARSHSRLYARSC